MNRRDMIKTSVATFMALSTASFAESTSKSAKSKENKNPKIVVVGGGWSGLSLAKDEAWASNGLGAQKTQFAWAQGMFDNMFYA